MVEREKEEAIITEVLAAVAAGSVATSRAIFVTGPVGRGRSSLLDFAASQAASSGGAAWQGRWPDGGNGPEALRPILPEAAFEGYDKSGALVADLENRVEAAQLDLGISRPGDDLDEPRWRAVQAIPPQALHFLIRRIYNIYTPTQMSEQAAAFVKTGIEHIVTLNATNLGQLRLFVDELKASFRAEDWELYLHPDEGLARALGQGVAKIAGNKVLLITIDDYAPAESSNDRWLKLVIEESGRTLWLFAAEVGPGWGEELQLAPLSASGVAAYFQAGFNRSLSQEEILWLTALSGGEPLALAIAADLFAGGATASELDAAVSRTPEDRLQGLFLYFVEENPALSQEEQMLLYCAALLRRPDRDFLTRFDAALKVADYSYNLENFAGLFSAHPWLGQNGELHPALKQALRQYLMLERRRFSQPIQEGIIEPARTVAVNRLALHESELVADATHRGSLAARAQDVEWGERVADVAYYRLWLDEAVGMFFLLPRWLMTLAYNEGLARQLLALVEGMRRTLYSEGQEILPAMRVLLTPGYSGGRERLEQKLKALEGLEEFGTSARGRWYKVENLGQRPQSGGSPEAELRGLLKWFQARLLEEAGQYERTASIYESVLATNVKMPEMERAAARSILALATRYRLKGANEAAFSAFSRAAELDGQPPEVQRALFYQAVRTRYFDTALKAADALEATPGYEVQGALYSIFALLALARAPEAQTELRTLLTHPAEQLTETRATFQLLTALAKLPADTPGLSEILEQLPAGDAGN